MYRSWARARTRLVADGRDQGIEIDLQGPYTPRHVALSHYNGIPHYNTNAAYRIDVRGEAPGWQTVVSESGNTSGRSTHKIRPVVARYVRLTVEQLFYASLLAIRELRAMGVPRLMP